MTSAPATPDDVIRLPAISLWQPWASLMVADGMPKRHETRHWPLPARCEGVTCLIHAAKRRIDRDLDRDLETICRFHFGDAWRETLPLGALIGVTRFFRAITTEQIETTTVDLACGNFDPGRFGWPHRSARRFATPLKRIGRQGFFTAEISRAVLAESGVHLDEVA